MIDLGDEAGGEVSREAYNAFMRALASRKTVTRAKTKTEHADPASCEQNVPQGVADAARTAGFVPGAEGNRTIEFTTVPWDPQAKIIADPLERAGIPYAVGFPADGLAAFELSREGGMFVESLAARYVAAEVMGAERFPNLKLPSAEAVYHTVEIEGRAGYQAVLKQLVREDVNVRFEWSEELGRGSLFFDDEGFARAQSILEARAASPAAWQESPAVDARSVAADAPADRASVIFQTREDDPKAQIIGNGLKRAGVNDFAVATPDPQGQVVISVAKSDAPALVQVCESYIDKGTIERARFQGLDALRERASAERETAEARSREGDIERARARAQRLSAGRGAVSPELSRTVTR